MTSNRDYIILAAFLCILLACAGTVSAKEIIVSDGSGNSTITAALANASSGDIITVTDGTYSDNVAITSTWNNIIIRSENGSGSTTIQASSSGSAVFSISYAKNVTIDGFNITGSTSSVGAIYLNYADNNTLINNTVTGNYMAVYLHTSCDYNIVENNVVSSNTQYGIWADENSNRNEFTNNTIIDSRNGLYIKQSSYNTLINNTATGNIYGIYLSPYSDYGSDYNTLINNTATGNSRGIYLSSSDYNTLINNTATSNTLYGIYLSLCTGNNLTGNAMSSNLYNFGVQGVNSNVVSSVLPDYQHDIDTSNEVDGKSIYYLQDLTSGEINSASNAGAVYLISCDNIIVKDFEITNESRGVVLVNSSYSTIENVTVSNAEQGIYLTYSDDNNLTSNSALYGSSYGIYIDHSDNNTLIGNNASNSNRGIYGYYLTNSTLIENIVLNNENFDLYASYSSDTVIDKLSLANNMTQISTVLDSSYIYINRTETNSIAPSDNFNVSVYVDIRNSGGSMPVTLYYNDSGITSADETSMSIYKLDGSNWVEVADTTLDTSNNSVSATLTGLSSTYTTFGLFYEDVPETWYVGDGADCNYTSIQTAINNVSERDIIVVTDGTYTENVDVNKSVIIRSENGSATTTVQALSSSDYVFNVTADDVTISGFNITGATTSNYAGIYLNSAESCTITNNTVTENNVGIYLYNSSSVNLVNNTADNNDVYGIRLYESDNANTLANNTMVYNEYGISLYNSTGSTLTGNVMSQNTYNFEVDSYTLEDYLHDIDSTNLVDNKPVYYWLNRSGGTISSDAGVAYAINCTGVTVMDANITNQSYGIIFAFTNDSTIDNVTMSDCYSGVYFYSTYNNTLVDNDIIECDYGIWFDDYSDNNTLTDNTISYSTYDGIYIEYSDNNTLAGNTFSYNGNNGVYIETSSYTTLEENDISSNYYGIRFFSSSNYNTLIDNDVMNNTLYGMYFSSSDNNTLTSNTASNNNTYGMYFSSSDNNTLTSNTASYNGRYGIYLSSSNNNTLANNVASYNIYSYIGPSSMSVDSAVEPMEVLGGPATGIFIGYSGYNVLTGNTANYNEGSNDAPLSVSSVVSPHGELGSLYSCGFSIYGSENTTLTGNTAIGNDDYAFYSRSSQNCTIDNLEIDANSMELSFVPTYETAIRSNETIFTVPSGKANVNGYMDFGLVEDLNLTIFYDDSGMSSSVESSISLFKLNGSEWVVVPNATLSTSGNFVSVNLDSGISVDISSIEDSTSTYGLFKDVQSSSGSSGSGTRASVSQGQDPSIVSSSASSVKRVTGGSEVDYDFSDSGTPVLGVSFDAKDDQGLVVAKVQVLSSSPEGVPAPSGNSYQMMSIDVGSEGTISSDSADNVMIHFKVSKQWVEENNIDVSTIRMTRYHGDQWNDLVTSQESEDSEYYYFYAETPGFSVFSVVGDEIGTTSVETPTSMDEEIEDPVDDEETPDTPGFTALAGIVFVSLAFFARRK